jgi:hypothetical protein
MFHGGKMNAAKSEDASEEHGSHEGAREEPESTSSEFGGPESHRYHHQQVIEAGEEASALGGWLSGSGSTVCCLAPDAKRAAAIATAMKRHAPKGSKTVIVAADNKGAHSVNSL